MCCMRSFETWFQVQQWVTRMWISSDRQVLVPPRCRSDSAGYPACGSELRSAARSRSVQNGRGGQPSRSGDEAPKLHRAEPPRAA
jgi:hypothetical protein